MMQFAWAISSSCCLPLLHEAICMSIFFFMLHQLLHEAICMIFFLHVKACFFKKLLQRNSFIILYHTDELVIFANCRKTLPELAPLPFFFFPWRIENYTTLFCVGDLLQEIWKVFKIILKITTKIGGCITAHSWWSLNCQCFLHPVKSWFQLSSLQPWKLSFSKCFLLQLQYLKLYSTLWESLLSCWIELQTSRAPPPLLSSQDF